VRSVLIPSELPASEESVSCIHDGRLDSAYDSERDPGVGHATCRETPQVSRVRRSDYRPSNILPTASIRLEENGCLNVKFRVVLRIVPLDVAQRQ
jgi:hypothetical protein